MSLRVNLLKKEECRYQGMVSMKVLILCMVSLLAGVTVVVITSVGVAKGALNANLDRARQEWARLEPREAQVRRVEQAAASNRNALNLLDARSRGEEVFVHAVLLELQRTIPDQMEIESLFAGKEGVGKASDETVLRMNGRTQGELTAVNARRALSSKEVITRFCGEVRLVSSRREEGDIWAYSIEGRREGSSK